VLENQNLEERSKFDPRTSEEQKPVVLDEFSLEYIPFQN
jgi:hypothetical protein